MDQEQIAAPETESTTRADYVKTRTETPVEKPVETVKPEVKAEVKAERDPNKTYTQEELDRIADKIKKNTERRTRKEIEAYYRGRESVAKPEPKVEAKPEVKEDAAPKRENFSDYEQYVEAKAIYAAEQAVSKREERIQKEREAQTAAQKKAEAIGTFQSKVRERFPDIDTRLEQIGHIVLPDGVGDALSDSEVGPEILAFMADNPKECERIAALSPSAALREIGKLEARLEPSPEKPKAKPSNAPEPISPVGGRGTVVDDAPKGTDSGDSYRLKRMREIAARKGQRTGTH